ncbi:hypothetical protein OG21DRAFT_1511546 [Imleria badia]|nr:hypothetical protein OG21DRAFT_1511546 [Imleria badia]
MPRIVHCFHRRLLAQIGLLHKQNFPLTDGACLNDMEYSIISFHIKRENDDLPVLAFFLEPEELWPSEY